MEWTELARLNVVVRTNLNGAEMISFVPNPRQNEIREDYWERSYIVTWSRPVRENQPSLDDDSFTYATHRVHVNSVGEAACYDGHYDQKRNAALYDMLERAHIEVPDGFALVRSK